VARLLTRARTQLTRWRETPFTDVPTFPFSALLQATGYGYDFCHADLPPADRGAAAEVLATEGARVADTLRAGTWWASDFGNHKAVAVHALAVAGAALLPEDDRGRPLVEAARASLTRDLLPAVERVGGEDGGWCEGISYNRKMALALIGAIEALAHARVADLWSQSGWLRHNGAFIAHHLLPDGRLLALGDVSADTPTAAERLVLGRLATQYGDPADAVLAADLPTLSTYVDVPLLAGFDVAYVDASAPRTPAAPRPPSRLFAGLGLALLRESWAPGATVVSFRAGPTFSTHQHADQNALTVFQHAPLAVDSGAYDDFWSSHSYNYYRRTIAHNTIIVLDPAERFPAPKRLGGPGATIVNDGGQNRIGVAPSTVAEYSAERELLETGRIEQYVSRTGYDYVRGDASAAYARAKLTRFVRELLFLHRRSPDDVSRVLVVDDLHLPRPDLALRWLLHTVARPELRTDSVIVRHGAGQMSVLPLTPSMDVALIGGPGREFVVDGRNFPPGRIPSHAPALGAWRIELRPRAPAAHMRLVTELVVGPGAAAGGTRARERDGVVVVTRGADHVVLGRPGTFAARLSGFVADRGGLTLRVEEARTGRVEMVTGDSDTDGAVELQLSGPGPHLVTVAEARTS
jgi:heparin/heparan-sulfate lyase